jgi:hypothetical protein
MGRISTFSARGFMQVMKPPLRTCLRLPRQISPHPNVADSGRRAKPDRRRHRQSGAPRRGGAHPPQPAAGTVISCAVGHAAARTAAAPSSHTATRSGAGWIAASSPGPARISLGLVPMRSSLRNTSPRCASSADDGTPDLRERISSRENATTGISVPSARPLTALSPTRTPVKLPGPLTTTIPPSSRSSVPADRSNSPTAATSVVEYVRPASSICPRISRSRPGSRPSATDPAGPQVSIARISRPRICPASGTTPPQTAASA